MTNVLTVMSSVWPSGSARAACWLPILPLAPGLFSTMTGLLPALLDLLAEQAREDVDAGAGRKRHDDGDGPLGQPLRESGRRDQTARARKQNRAPVDRERFHPSLFFLRPRDERWTEGVACRNSRRPPCCGPARNPSLPQALAGQRSTQKGDLRPRSASPAPEGLQENGLSRGLKQQPQQGFHGWRSAPAVFYVRSGTEPVRPVFVPGDRCSPNPARWAMIGKNCPE